MLSITEIPLGDPRLNEFVLFPRKLYKNDPCWTPPLDGDLLGNPLLGLKGLLTPNHPYHRRSEVTHFLARRGGQTVGCISAAVNREYNAYHHTSIGSFGFFEVVDDYEVAKALLDQVRDWVKGKGMTVLRGPGQYSNATHERQGVLIEGFQYPPSVELTHNPPYYDGFLQKYGFLKAKDYVAYVARKDAANVQLIKRLGRVANKISNLTTRPIVIKDLKAEVKLILDIYNEAWSQNWGFLPITPEEGDALADTLRLIIDPGLVRFGFIDGEPAAVLGLIPDPNYALRPRWHWYGDSDLVRIIRLLLTRHRITKCRAFFFGVKEKYRQLGIPAAIGSEVADYLLNNQRYQEFEGSLLLEDNRQIIKLVETFGGEYYKRWRIYDLPLT